MREGPSINNTQSLSEIVDLVPANCSNSSISASAQFLPMVSISAHSGSPEHIVTSTTHTDCYNTLHGSQGDIAQQGDIQRVKLVDENLENVHKPSISFSVPVNTVPSPPPTPPPPPLTPGTTPGSSRSSSRCSSPSPCPSRSTSPLPSTPGAASLKILSPSNSDTDVSEFGPRCQMACSRGREILTESFSHYQSASPSSADISLGEQIGKSVELVMFDGPSYNKQASRGGISAVNSGRRGQSYRAGLTDNSLSQKRAKVRCLMCQELLGENGYVENNELISKNMVLTDGMKTLAVKDRDFLVENDLSNSLLYLIGSNRICSNCKACKVCSEDRQFINSKELAEQQLYREQLEYCPKNRRVVTDFLFVDKSCYGATLGQFGDHSNISLQRNTRMEEKILRSFSSETVTSFNQEMSVRFRNKEFVTYQECMSLYGETFSKLTKYFSPINYARREGKANHCIRPIFDTSTPSPKNKLCFNSFLMCGPSVNTDLLHSWYTVRNFRYVGISDLDKFFNTVMLRLKSQALCSFHWKVNEKSPGQDDGLGSVFPWTQCVATRLEFGQKSSPFLAGESLKLAREKFCQMEENIDGQHCSVYVDDYLIYNNNIAKLYLMIGDICSSLIQASFSFKKWDFTKSARQYWLPEFETMLKQGAKVDEELMKSYESWKQNGSFPPNKIRGLLGLMKMTTFTLPPPQSRGLLGLMKPIYLHIGVKMLLKNFHQNVLYRKS